MARSLAFSTEACSVMALSPGGAQLEIENEAGAVYRVDLGNRASIQVSGPPQTATPKPPTEVKPNL
ncbi:hypothetical protein [Pelomonas aquatica]|jgi:hypothetical protein|uniref:Uncharacterized protein n=1 Tax=Pelomonas aquatica TaxID=431058 RepID=A0A9X4LPE3_9BURK|nr:hypothetical protein [Pelomonas aquatica]MCY4756714.1 hypothetical protein [Pelomonas aquatica]MDG0864008.1 hypothetical protein [Pelomonas aquatica]